MESVMPINVYVIKYIQIYINEKAKDAKMTSDEILKCACDVHCTNCDNDNLVTNFHN